MGKEKYYLSEVGLAWDGEVLFAEGIALLVQVSFCLRGLGCNMEWIKEMEMDVYVISFPCHPSNINRLKQAWN